jgi:hypothetical protein
LIEPDDTSTKDLLPEQLIAGQFHDVGSWNREEELSETQHIHHTIQKPPKFLAEIIGSVVEAVMSQPGPGANAKAYSPADHEPVPPGFKPNRFGLHRMVARQRVHRSPGTIEARPVGVRPKQQRTQPVPADDDQDSDWFVDLQCVSMAAGSPDAGG